MDAYVDAVGVKPTATLDGDDGKLDEENDDDDAEPPSQLSTSKYIVLDSGCAVDSGGSSFQLMAPGRALV
jgi:hypothetical protein